LDAYSGVLVWKHWMNSLGPNEDVIFPNIAKILVKGMGCFTIIFNKLTQQVTLFLS
jgi:hypothetical protein